MVAATTILPLCAIDPHAHAHRQRGETTVVDFRVHEGVPRGTLAGEWELLMEEDPHATVFHGPRYLAVWHEALGARATARTYTLHREGRLIGVIPEAHELVGSATGPVEVRRPAYARAENIDFAVQFLTGSAPRAAWWCAWDDHFGNRVWEESIEVRNGTIRQYIPYAEETVIGFRWEW
jgi:hypothetical protein